MNITLWILQILLALHTIMGAVWKFSKNAEQTMASLKAIPDRVWMAMAIVELLCSLGLILPAFSKSIATLAPIAALFIVAEMLLFSAMHLSSGSGDYGPIVYWVAVAAVAAFITFGRFVLVPVNA